MPFVERRTEDGNHVVVLRYAAIVYWLMWPTFGATILPSLALGVISNVIAIAAWAIFLSVAIPHWPIIFELRRRMRDGFISATGSKYSFSNPLTYRWPIDSDAVQ